MKDEGKYLQLWMKYIPVIRLLLKRSECENQKLQLYKHEFENGGKDKTGYAFGFDMINGKVLNNVRSTAVATDLLQMLDNNSDIRNWLKEHNVRFSMDKTLELHIDKIEIAVPSENR
jgi:hypothetical protein